MMEFPGRFGKSFSNHLAKNQVWAERSFSLVRQGSFDLVAGDEYTKNLY
jgi:hypothetical protein